MATQYGVSFQPGQENGQGPNGERKVAPVQEAVRMLSLRLPTVSGARGIAPDALLHGQGGAGVETGGFSLEAALELLRKLRGSNLPPQLNMPQALPSPVSTRLPQPERPQPTPRFDQSPDPYQPFRPQPLPTPTVTPGQLSPETWREAKIPMSTPEPLPVEQSPADRLGGYYGDVYDPDSEYHRG